MMKIKAKAMAKSDEVKKAQGYDGSPRWPVCMNCEFHSVAESEFEGWGFKHKETKHRCILGDFETRPGATCQRHGFNGDRK